MKVYLAYGWSMRTTLTIDDDILSVARERADIEGKTVGKVLSALARQSLCPPQPVQQFRNGIPQLPIQPGAGISTPELIRQLMDELP
jgi:hypothetical protein